MARTTTHRSGGTGSERVHPSVDTYLRFAEAVERLELAESPGADLPELLEQGARRNGRGLHGELRPRSESVHAG